MLSWRTHRESRGATRGAPAASGRLALLVTPLVVLLTVALTSTAWAQEAPPPAGPSWGPEAIVDGLLNGLGQVLQGAMTQWVQDAGPLVLGRLVATLLGGFLTVLRDLAGGTLGGASLYLGVPPQWSYDLPVVRDVAARLRPVAVAVLALSLTLGVVLAGVGTLLGRPFSRLFAHAGAFLFATAGLVVGFPLVRWWIDLLNALTLAMIGGGGLPGLEEAQGLDLYTAQGVVALLYTVVAVLFLLTRLKLLVIVAGLVAVAPLAIACGAVPFAQCQRFFGWWLSTLLAASAVGVLQAACLAIAAAFVASPLTAGGGPDQQLVGVAAGIGGVLAAQTLPPFLLGALAGGTTIGVMSAVATRAAGFAGLPAPVAAASAAVQSMRRPPPPAPAAPPAGGAAPAPGSGYTRSLLGGT